jgi:hypothetical protein
VEILSPTRSGSSWLPITDRIVPATLREVENADLLIRGRCGPSEPSRQIAAVDEVLGSSFRTSPAAGGAEQGRPPAGRYRARVRIARPEGILISALRPPDIDLVRERLRLAVREQRAGAGGVSSSRRRELLAVARRERSEAYLDGRLWSEWWLDPRDAARLRRAGFRVENPPEEPSADRAGPPSP